MKKLVLALLLAIAPCMAYGTTLEAVTALTQPVANSNYVQQYVYTGATVSASTTQVFSFETPWYYGRFVEVRFSCVSGTDSDVWISTAEDKAITAPETIWGAEGINIGGGFELSSPIYFFNAAKKNYLTVKNDDPSNATGAWTLVVTYEIGGY